MNNRYKVVWHHPDVVFAKPYARSIGAARQIASDMLHTKLPIVKPLGAWILRRSSFKHGGATYIDWVPVAVLGKVPV